MTRLSTGQKVGEAPSEERELALVVFGWWEDLTAGQAGLPSGETIVVALIPSSLNRFCLDHRLHRAEFPITNAAYHHQMLYSAKGSVFQAVRDYSFSSSFAYARQFFEFTGRSEVYV